MRALLYQNGAETKDQIKKVFNYISHNHLEIQRDESNNWWNSSTEADQVSERCKPKQILSDNIKAVNNTLIEYKTFLIKKAEETNYQRLHALACNPRNDFTLPARI